MFKVATIIGARPQFIKAATISRVITQINKTLTSTLKIEEIIIHTGQHYDENMSKIFFDELEISKPHYNLAVGSTSHGTQTGRMLERIETVLLSEKPDVVLVYGDTNSTLAGSLSAAKLNIPVAHVEAGLRSFNRNMPEEINRVLTDHISDFLFTPTDVAVNNLKREGIPSEKIYLVGDVMFDATIYYGSRSDQKSNIMSKFGLKPKQYILATIHRPSNTDHPAHLKAIFKGLSEVSNEIPVILPLHPRTRIALERNNLIPFKARNLNFIEPLGFLDMVMLEKNARLIATDSGGVQKEAFFQKVPCITLREETEWLELLDLGWNRLVPPVSSKKIAWSIKNALRTEHSSWTSVYGNGNSAKKIVTVLSEIFYKKDGQNN